MLQYSQRQCWQLGQAESVEAFKGPVLQLLQYQTQVYVTAGLLGRLLLPPVPRLEEEECLWPGMVIDLGG